MMKRSKNLHITIDSLPSGLHHHQQQDERGLVNSGGAGSTTSLSPSVISIANFIGIGNGMNMKNFGFRRRKNFSLILLAGLSALLCALYYTSYYPGTVWTLRLGVTSFNNTQNNQQRRDSVARSSSGGGGVASYSHNDLKDGAAAGLDLQVEIFPSVPVGNSRGWRAKNDGESIPSNSHRYPFILPMSGGSSPNGNDNGYNNAHPKEDAEGEEAADNPDEISTPKTWNWKYWASLEYWKVNFTYDDNEEEEEQDWRKELSSNFGNSPPEEKLADVMKRAKPVGVGEASLHPQSSDFSAHRLPETSPSISGGRGTPEKVTDFQGKRRQRLACNFPRLKPFDPSITEFIKAPPVINCARAHPLVFRTDFRNKLILWGHPFPRNNESSQGRTIIEGAGNFSCCYKTMTRGNGSDHNIIYSKRCYPIVKVETEIPADHEFISVRCRSISVVVGNHHQNAVGRGNVVVGQKQMENEGPPESNKETNKDGNNGSNNSSNNNDNTSTTTTSKVYRDMLAFVPLKPEVEDRIRKFEESKRKSLYAQKKVGVGSVSKSNKIREKANIPKGSVAGSQEKEEGELLKQGINLSGERTTARQRQGDYYENKSGVVSPFKSLLNGEEADDARQSEKGGGGDYAKPTLSNEDRLSVVILGLDAQSHMNFIRQMPLTYNFLTKNLSAIGMYGYTKVGDNTFPNVVTLLSGRSVEELEKVCWPTKQSYFDSCPFIWKKFSENGYRTSLAEDSVWMGTFNYEKKGFLHPPTDYYLHPFIMTGEKKIGHECWANAKLCYGPRLAFEVLLDYIVKTAVTFTNSLYFQFVWANSLFHDYLNNPRMGDELLAMTLEFMRNNRFFENTAFILLSDHGIRWGSIRSTYQGKIEERMPVAYFAFPSWFRSKYPEAMRNLRRNMLRLTTPFDIYETLRDILRIGQGKRMRFDRWCDYDDDDNDDDSDHKGDCGGGGGEARSKSSSRSGSGGVKGSEHLNKNDQMPPRGISLFRPVPLERTCKMAGIEEHWCVCHKMEKVPINSTLVESGAQFVLNIINGLVRKHGELCAKLELVRINEAKRKIDGDIDRGLDVDFFLTGTASTAAAQGKSTTTTKTLGRNRSLRTAGDSDRISYGKVGAAVVADNDYSITRKSDRVDVGERDAARTGSSSGDGASKRKSDDDDDDESRAQRIGSSNDDGIKKKKGAVESDNVIRSISTTSDIKKMIQLQITFVTQPGDAVFEATIYGEADSAVDNNIIIRENGEERENMILEEESNGATINHHWKLSGDISRLNLYGKQSACVTDYKVQKYCYCKDFKPE